MAEVNDEGAVEPGPSVQGAYNLKMSPFQPTERSTGPENQPRPSQAVEDEMNRRAEEYHQATTMEGEPTKKTVTMNGQKVEVETTPIVELTPEQKAKAVFDKQYEEYQKQQAQANAPKPEPPPPPKEQSEYSKAELKYKQELGKATEIENKFREEKLKAQLEEEQKKAQRTQTEFERKYNLTNAQKLAETKAGIEGTKLMQEEAQRQKAEQYKKEHPILSGIGTAAERANKSFAVKNLTQGLQQSATEAAKAGVQPNIKGLMQQVTPTPVPAPTKTITSEGPGATDAYRSTAEGIGGNYQNAVQNGAPVLEALSVPKQSYGDTDSVLFQKIGGVRERG